jgi:hypothetical protein
MGLSTSYIIHKNIYTGNGSKNKQIDFSYTEAGNVDNNKYFQTTS